MRHAAELTHVPDYTALSKACSTVIKSRVLMQRFPAICRGELSFASLGTMIRVVRISSSIGHVAVRRVSPSYAPYLRRLCFNLCAVPCLYLIFQDFIHEAVLFDDRKSLKLIGHDVKGVH